MTTPSQERTRGATTVDGVSPTLPAWLASQPELAVPAKVGRYIVEEKIGQGGMGVVFAARDEVLDRRVAIKLLRSDRAGSEGRARMLREAKALAKLSHPNIVPVYEAGEASENGVPLGTDEAGEAALVYIVMELVTGRSLRDLLADEAAEPWATIALYVQAAAGLRAAHEAGLVHRDFKPANVLLGDDGRVRVADFGLAVVADLSADAVDSIPTPSLGSGTSATAGTPAYMAPEQRNGEAVDARSDQYSFCVALWHALHGVNPVRETPLVDLVDGELDLDSTDRARVPRRVCRALYRGLRRDPSQRHPSMAVLMSALEQRPKRGFAMAVVGLAAIGLGAAALQSDDDPCESVGDELAQTYDEVAREQLESQLGAVDPSTRVLTAADEFASAWTAARDQVCRAQGEGGSEERYNRQIACLDERRAELAALIDLATGPTSRSARVIDGALALRSPTACADPIEVERDEPPAASPKRLEQRAELRAELASLRTKLLALDLEGFPDALDRVEALAESAADTPMLADVELARGRYALHRSQLVSSAAAFERAFELAEQSAYQAAAGEAATRLITVRGEQLFSKSEGDVWSKVAEAKVMRTGSPRARALLAQAQGSFALVHADYSRAQERLDAALAQWTEIEGASHPRVASVLGNLGDLAFAQDDTAKAMGRQQQALEMRTSLFGEEHPQVADTLANLSQLSVAQGDSAAARIQLDRALGMLEATDPNIGTSRGQVLLALAELERSFDEIDKAVGYYDRALEVSVGDLGKDAPLVAQIKSSYAALHIQVGNYPPAKQMALSALAVQEQALGPQHPHVGVVLNTLGTAHQWLEEYGEAKAALGRAIEIYRAKFGPQTVKAVAPLSNIGLVEQAQQNHDAARRYFEEALELERAHLGDQHPNLVFDYFYLGVNEMERGAPEAAVPFFAKAHAIQHPMPVMRGEAALALAKAQAEAGQPWQDAGEAAQAAFKETGNPEFIASVDDWVAEQRKREGRAPKRARPAEHG